MQSERLFEQAVQLAAAFVANGDIRLGDAIARPEGSAQAKLADLIPVLYGVLERARDQLVDDADGARR